MNINGNFAFLADNYLFYEVAERVEKFRETRKSAKIISLGIGDVTLPIPKIIIDDFIKACDELAVKETFKGYPPTKGYGFLREAVAEYYLRHGVKIDAEEVFISDGAKSACDDILKVFSKITALIVNPTYPAYVDGNILHGNEVKFVNVDEGCGFLPTPHGVKKGEYLIYLCSPNNPTGTCLNKRTLENWVEFATESSSIILFDSAYAGYIRDGSPRSVFEINGAKKCAIEIGSLSKSFGFTGVRCGWTIIPKELKIGDNRLIDRFLRSQSATFNGVSYPVQRVARTALTVVGEKACEKNVNTYLENAKAIKRVFQDKGFTAYGGDNSPYVWVKCPENVNSWVFFDRLLKDVEIVCTPGVGFGSAGEGFVRLTGFCDGKNVTEAVKRLNITL